MIMFPNFPRHNLIHIHLLDFEIQEQGFINPLSLLFLPIYIKKTLGCGILTQQISSSTTGSLSTKA